MAETKKRARLINLTLLGRVMAPYQEQVKKEDPDAYFALRRGGFQELLWKRSPEKYNEMWAAYDAAVERRESTPIKVMRIPGHADHRFRSMAISDSDSCRSPIPEHADR